jgi:phosphatidylglycerol lysyltransferase
MGKKVGASARVAGRPLWSIGAQGLLSLALVLLFLRLLQLRLDSVDIEAVQAAFARVSGWQWLAALALTGLSFHAVGRYDVLIHRHLCSGADPAVAGRAGMAAIALSQTLGLGVVTGGLVRWRLLPRTGLWQASRLSALVALSFLAGWALVTAGTLLLIPEAPFRPLAALVLAAGFGLMLLSLAAPPLRLRDQPLRWPNAFTLGGLLALTALDTLAAGGALWLLCPPGEALPLARFLPAFLLALGAGLVSGTPGGVGAFEMTLLALLPEAPEAPLLAAVLAWRGVYYALPALLGAALLARGPGRPAPACPPPVAGPPPAEAGLARQGQLALLDSGWLAGRTPHLLVGLLDPFAPAGEALPRLIAEARAEARLPCLYKCGARTAVAARHQGFALLPVAREAWLDPQGFRLDRPALAGLRRKLRKAAGLRITRPATLPLAEMQQVAQSWARARGGERGFSMGRFCPDYVGAQRVYLGWDGARLAGFVTFHEGPGRDGRGEWVLDLMRQAATAPDGTMQALVLQAITDAAAAGVGRLSLAAVPLHEGPECWPARLAHRLAGVDLSGLERFKAGFAPRWDPLYLAAPSRAALLLAGVEIARAIHRPGRLPRQGARSPPEASRSS